MPPNLPSVVCDLDLCPPDPKVEYFMHAPLMPPTGITIGSFFLSLSFGVGHAPFA